MGGPQLTDEEIALLKGKAFAHMTTLAADGRPRATPIWTDVDPDGHLMINTARGRVKDRDVRRDPRVVLSIAHPEDPYRWLSVQGEVVSIEEGAEAEAHIQELAWRYWETPYDRKSPPRVILRIRPTKILRSS